MSEFPGWMYNQSAVIPFRRIDSKLEILLITSRNKKKWIIPKGIIENHLSPQDSAAKEALEEAGVEGRVFKKCMGNFDYDKWGGTCNIQVFALEVEIEHSEWEEKDFRKRKWCSAKKAIKKVTAVELKEIFRKFIKILNNNELK